MFTQMHSWQVMAEFLNLLMALSYAIAPVCLLTLRRQLPQQRRPFRLPFAYLWANLAFILCNLITYFTGWDIISKLCIALIAGVIILFSYHRLSERGKSICFDWRASVWLWPYLAGISLISYLGQFNGKGIIPAGWDYLIIAAFSVAIMHLAIHFRLDDEMTQEYITDLNLKAH